MIGVLTLLCYFLEIPGDPTRGITVKAYSTFHESAREKAVDAMFTACAL